MAGVVERIKALRAPRADGRDARRVARTERARKQARAEAQRLEHERTDPESYGRRG